MGVDLDQEAANLLRFQQMYQANARVLTVAKDVFETVLGAMR
ncbi:MAG: flagellar basal body rod C-terminal domain-containing protein [Pseudomonadota bacterium]